MRNLFSAGEPARLTRAVARARNLERRYAPAAASSSGEAFGIGQRKAFTAVQNTITNLYPFDDFDTTDSSIYEQDGGTGTLKVKETGLYRVEAWLVMYALETNIPATVTPSLIINTGGISAPNSVIDLFIGQNSNINGHAVVTGPTNNSWQLSAATYFNIGSAPYLFSTSLIGDGGANTHTWQVDWAILAATRIGDYSAALDLSPFGS